MYIHDGAIEALVRAKLSLKLEQVEEGGRPLKPLVPLFASANLVNHPRLSHVHQRRGLVKDFHITPPPKAAAEAAAEATAEAAATSVPATYTAVPLVNDPTTDHPTDLCRFSDDPWGYAGYADWRCAVTLHESFLADLETGHAHRWARLGVDADNGKDDDNDDDGDNNDANLFAFHDVGTSNFTRWSINAMAMELTDLADVASNAAAAELLINDEQVT